MPGAPRQDPHEPCSYKRQTRQTEWKQQGWHQLLNKIIMVHLKVGQMRQVRKQQQRVAALSQNMPQVMEARGRGGQ